MTLTISFSDPSSNADLPHKESKVEEEQTGSESAPCVLTENLICLGVDGQRKIVGGVSLLLFSHLENAGCDDKYSLFCHILYSFSFLFLKIIEFSDV